MSDNHPEHAEGSDHGHAPHPGVGSNTLPRHAKRIKAIEALLIEKGVVTPDEVRNLIDYLDSRSPADGARMVARAWVDPEYKARLLADPRAAATELGIDITRAEETKFVVVENTEQVHHLIVCTLCSCYPRPILGRPPDWYKSFNYRSRAVVDPRGVMREFGLELDDEVEVQVHDSTANVRYLVLPQRPPGTDGLTEAELAQLVTRDSMIGVSKPLPEPVRVG